MTGKPERNINWSLTTWKGSRLQQHRKFHALPFSRKLKLIEEMGEIVEQFGSAPPAGQPPAALREDAKPYGAQRHPSPGRRAKPRKRKG